MMTAVEVLAPAEVPALVLPDEARYVTETATGLATRYGGMVKLQEAPQVIATPTRPNTTTPGKEIVMPSHDTALLSDEPKKPQHRPWRRGTKRGLGDRPMLYFMRCTTCDLIKIGISGDYRKRRVELERRTGHTLDVMGIEWADAWVEAQVHKMFRVDRVRGEWYRESDAILAYIAKHCQPPHDKRGAQ